MQKESTPSPVARALLTTCPCATTQVLPNLGDAVDQPLAQAAEEAAEEESPPSRRLTALVIDDTGAHRHVATSLLERFGFDVEQAIHGLQGLEMMIEKRFDVVLCDYEMPELDGFACVSEFRQWEHEHRPQQQKQPVVCFTGSLEQRSGIAAQGLEAGMDLVVAKPYSRGKLENALEQVQML